MKKVLVTGVNSYVGNSFAEWVEQYPDEYEVDRISVRDDKWEEIDLSVYDSILHVAGIAHVSTDPKMEEKYYKVNRDLTIELSKAAKNAKVKQFIFMSSIIVYGDSKAEKIVIDRDTKPNPSNFYGRSKLEAEEGILSLEDDYFKVAIVRPPMIYGKDSKGNYPKLAKAAQKLPIFPDIDNKRSMLHIDNLSEFLRLVIKNEDKGLFFPQNKEYVKTSDIVRLIASSHRKNIRLTKLFNPILKLLISRVNLVNKVFGNLMYEQKMSKYQENYIIHSLSDSIYNTEKAKVKYKYNNESIDILLMSDNGLDTVGGEQESTKIIINGVKDDFNLGVIQPGDLTQPTLGVHYYPMTPETRIKHLIKKPLSFLKYINQVRKIIKTEKPRVIHTQAQVSFFIIALLKKFYLIHYKTILIHTERGLYTKYNNLFKRIFFFFMKELDVLVTTTEFNMSYWKKALLKKGYKIDFKIIENTAGELFEAYDERRERPKDDKIVIGFAGRYADWKNWPLAVEISEKLKEQLDEKLIVRMAVGCLDKQAEQEAQKMFNHMTNLLDDNFKGEINITLEAMDKFYYDIDVFILTSNYNTESFGRTLVEAMNRKTVVFTTDAGGSVEVVGDLSKVHTNVDSFVKSIININNDKKMMFKEKENNFMRVRNLYSYENNIKKHKCMYNQFLT